MRWFKKKKLQTLPQVAPNELEDVLNRLDLPQSFTKKDRYNLKQYLLRVYPKSDFGFIQPFTLRLLAQTYEVIAQHGQFQITDFPSLSFFPKLLPKSSPQNLQT